MDKRFGDLLTRVAGGVEKLSKNVEQTLRGAAESATGQQVRRTLSEVAPQVRRAVDEVRPQVKRVVDEIRPGAKRVYEQVAPEVKKVVDEISPNLKRAWDDLFGHHTPPPSAIRDDVPPNVSPDAYPHSNAPEDDDEDVTPVDLRRANMHAVAQDESPEEHASSDEEHASSTSAESEPAPAPKRPRKPAKRPAPKKTKPRKGKS